MEHLATTSLSSCRCQQCPALTRDNQKWLWREVLPLVKTWALNLIKPHCQHGTIMTAMLQWMAATRTGLFRSTFLEHLLCANGCLCFMHELVQPHSPSCTCNASTTTTILNLVRRLSPDLTLTSSSQRLTGGREEQRLWELPSFEGAWSVV